jgi:maltodextrin utilization protein YvdJ
VLYNDEDWRISIDVESMLKETEQKTENSEKPSLKELFRNKEYRGSTIMALLLAIFNQMSGINIIVSYTTNIFNEIKLKGAVSSLTLQQQSQFIGLSGFTGALLAAISVGLLSRRVVFILGHALIGTFLILVGIFINVGSPNGALVSMCLCMISF